MKRESQIVDRFATFAATMFSEAEYCHLPEMPASARAVTAWAMLRSFNRPVVWVCDGAQSLETLHRDMATLCHETSGPVDRLLYLPEWESVPAGDALCDPEIAGQRLATLLATCRYHDSKEPAPSWILATCAQALMQKTLTPAEFSKYTLRIGVGDEVETDNLAGRLSGAGYDFTDEVDAKGQASVRGGLLDVWPVTDAWPLRIELMGATIESIRAFDPADQRSRGHLTSSVITPASEWPFIDRPREDRAGKDDDPSAGILAYLPKEALLVWDDPESIAEHAQVLEDSFSENRVLPAIVTYQVLQDQVAERKGISQVWVGAVLGGGASELPVDVGPVDSLFDVPGNILEPDAMEECRRRLFVEIAEKAGQGWDVTVYFDTKGSHDHFRAMLQIPGRERFHAEVGAISGGFVSQSMKLAVVAESDIMGRQRLRAQRYDPHGKRARGSAFAGRQITDLSGVGFGDLVVHADHGVGRYIGPAEIVFNGQMQEVLTIEYADDAKLHVPVSQAHLLSRYVGLAKQRTTLHRLGGRRWNKDKQAAQEAVMDLAASLLETQAQRTALKGHAFPADTAWQHDFEMSFPYQETDDQERAIDEVKADLEAPHPMDRLVCGDAGYGKTEVAMRAAFKVAASSKQVAVLVPTTVLALQHFETFSERIAAYPFRVEMLSRFCSRPRRNEIIEGLKDGTVDIVIGTHALVQPTIRFQDLGLVIIDEEQRFGVQHKEQLKHMRRLVDVLTLTATPIPRTLYLSMTGAREMSLIRTPPRERMAIETIITKNSDDVTRKAILRELNREGQVFYLHNRVMTIEKVKARLERLVPEARCAVAHGQMPTGELSKIMHKFVSGEYDVLVCTTIIESGVDIPRVNTILIDRADRFGIADLYQLRGRVGRSNHKAYAYLLLPPRGRLDSDARRRIGAVKKYSSLSAGFNLAVRDMEIRGAGNILGAQQSGYIAAVGFSLYCQLLKQSVARMKGEELPPVADVEIRIDFLELAPTSGNAEARAAIPYNYIEEDSLRVAIYNKLSLCSRMEDVDSIREELRDRFGRIPPPVRRLLTVSTLRVRAAEKNVKLVEVREGKVRLFRNSDYVMKNSRFPRLTEDSTDRCLEEILKLVMTIDEWGE
jgi:transcription-repair coupling factor (superfamily II helicase)